MKGRPATNNNVAAAPSTTTTTTTPPKASFFDNSIVKRGFTIVLVGPVIVYFLSTPAYHAFFAWALVFMAMIEWTSMKRHLKVALLHEDGDKFPEYATPVAKTNLFILCKCFASSLIVIPASYSAELFGLFMSGYFMFWVVFTLMGQHRAETVAEVARKKVINSSFPEAVTSQRGDPTPDVTPPTSPIISLASLSPAERFLHQELSIIANKCNTDLFLSFALEYFGFCWIMGICNGLMMGHLGPIGTLFQVVVVLSNWTNDIVALIVGRSLKGRSHALHPRISPNKSVEGAVAGTIANGFMMSFLVVTFYNPETMYLGQDVMPVWISAFFAGILLGVIGVIGDLLQSLFKRSARIKDCGAIFPGHGGILDRLDGFLLCLPVSYWLLWLLTRYFTPAEYITVGAYA